MDSHKTISHKSVDRSCPAALLPDGGPVAQECPLHPALNFKPLGLGNGESQWVSEERAYSDFPLEKKKNKNHICTGLALSTEYVRTVLSTSGLSACPCLSEATGSVSWDLATSKGDADIIEMSPESPVASQVFRVPTLTLSSPNGPCCTGMLLLCSQTSPSLMFTNGASLALRLGAAMPWCCEHSSVSFWHGQMVCCLSDSR